jgi:hypothetical protein
MRLDLSHDERITATAIARVADFLAACGFPENEIARSLVIEGIARGRAAAGPDEWIERLSKMTATLARHTSDGNA